MKRIELAALSSYLMRSPFASNVPIWGAACPGFFQLFCGDCAIE